jgi:hypothetical protein
MLRSTVAVVWLVSHLSIGVSGRDSLPSRVRAVDAWAQESLERALAGSALVRALLLELEHSDLIVHVDSSTRIGIGLGGMSRLAGDTGGARYARITLYRDLAPDVRAATLAHELQHAVELAHSNARTHTDVQQLFERIGYRQDAKRMLYETTAAQKAGARAWTELRRGCGLSSCSRAASAATRQTW